jgi:phosphatidylserine/phosphatidylglycerophosphate/cardiolipin synthase-like enzyme
MTRVEERFARVRLLVDRDHYDTLVALIRGARTSLWIATANLKELLVEAPVGTRARARGRYASIAEDLGDLVKRNVDVRMLHASPPSGPMTRTLTREKAVKARMKMCPRVHLKMIAVDGAHLYLGSANFTGAGLGAKGDGRRNFEMGVVTDDDVLLDAAQARFDRIWRGKECASCRLRDRCPKPIDGSGRGGRRRD